MDLDLIQEAQPTQEFTTPTTCSMDANYIVNERGIINKLG